MILLNCPLNYNVIHLFAVHVKHILKGLQYLPEEASVGVVINVKELHVNIYEIDSISHTHRESLFTSYGKRWCIYGKQKCRSNDTQYEHSTMGISWITAFVWWYRECYWGQHCVTRRSIAKLMSTWMNVWSSGKT